MHLWARFTNGDQTAVQLIQIKSDLQFNPQIKLKAFHQHICGSDHLTHTLTREKENTGSDWLGKMTVSINYIRHSSQNIIEFAIYNHNGST